MELPVLLRSPEERQHCGHEPGHILAQLSAALENPDIKALKWSKDGQGVLVHTKLYKKEMEKNKNLFPELADLSCVTALQAWLLAHKFKLKESVKLQVLLFQHPDFQRAHPSAKEMGALGGDASLSAKQQQRKRKSRARSLHPPRRATAQDRQRKQPCLRALYQYINLSMPELMQPSAEDDDVPVLAQPSQAPVTPRRATAPQLEDPWASSTPKIPAPEAGDEFTQVNIDEMLQSAAQLVSLLLPPFEQLCSFLPPV